MYVRAGRPAFARPCVGVHKSTSLTSSSLLLQQCPACLKTQQNSKYRLCGDREEIVNHIISECSKLAQKEYETRLAWVGKVILREMCKKCYTNGSPHLGQKTRPYNNQQKKKICKTVDFAVPADHIINWKNVKREISTSTLRKNWKKLWNRMTIIPIVIVGFGTVTKILFKGLEDLKVGGRVETIQATTLLKWPEYWEESRKLEETCCHSIFGERPQLTLMWKTLMSNSNNKNRSD